MTHPTLALILSIQPANAPGLALLDRLLANPPDAAALIGMQVEIERALNDVERLAARSRDLCRRVEDIGAVAAVDVGVVEGF